MHAESGRPEWRKTFVRRMIHLIIVGTIGPQLRAVATSWTKVVALSLTLPAVKAGGDGALSGVHDRCT
jgi:hypothetical protein